MAIKRFSTEIGLACAAVVFTCSRPALSALPSAPYALPPLSEVIEQAFSIQQP